MSRGSIITGRLGLAMFAGVALATSAIGQYPLLRWFPREPSNPFPLNIIVTGLLVGDFTGDSADDVVTVLQALGGVSFYRNDGSGRFTLEPGFPIQVQGVYTGCTGDFDRDGHLDFFVTCCRGATGAQDQLFFGDGAGHFTNVSATSLPQVVQNSYFTVAGDIDRDGRPDLLRATDTAVEVLHNNGAGAFTMAAQLPATTGGPLVLGDIDGDGDEDLLLAGYQCPSWLFLNDGSGNFTLDSSGRLVLPNPSGIMGAVLADIDGDSDLDLLCASAGPQPRATCYINDGSGFFTDQTAARLPALPATFNQYTTFGAVGAADLDGDGDLDLVFASRPPQGLGDPDWVLENTGGGLFVDRSAAWMTPDNQAGAVIAVSDIDNDGDQDVIVGNMAGLVWQSWTIINTNTTRQLYCPTRASPGTVLRFDLFGTPGDTAVLFMGHVLQRQTVPPFGNVYLPPGAMVLAGSGTISPTRMLTLGYPIPANPGLVGVPLVFQAAVGPPNDLLAWRTTNFWRRVVEP